MFLNTISMCWHPNCEVLKLAKNIVSTRCCGASELRKYNMKGVIFCTFQCIYWQHRHAITHHWLHPKRWIMCKWANILCLLYTLTVFALDHIVMFCFCSQISSNGFTVLSFRLFVRCQIVLFSHFPRSLMEKRYILHENIRKYKTALAYLALSDVNAACILCLDVLGLMLQCTTHLCCSSKQAVS